MDFRFSIIFALIFALIFAIFFIRAAKKQTKLIRDVEAAKAKRIRTYLVTGSINLIVTTLFFYADQLSFPFYIFAAITASQFIAAFCEYVKQPTHKQFLHAYAADSSKCGRCNYSLAHITTQACPECGWQLPNLTNLKIQSPAILFWWKQWRIDYLESPRKTTYQMLWLVSIFSLLLPASFLFYYLYFPEMTIERALARTFLGPQVIILFMILHFTINLIRVIQYRCRKEQQEA
ncbi:hypothetical protein [Poriferisphaera sp. WC338]|uniref:hypothetical protein n=1 Tax=Poriferisphaera sp. WC338 TaxID=3425129 RepID=UPI003D8132F8